jgi:hypothetical protein
MEHYVDDARRFAFPQRLLHLVQNLPTLAGIGGVPIEKDCPSAQGLDVSNDLLGPG